ncbi:MAG: class I SAM-dependent rRNA methyltransferase [Cytophagaceae bacterium]
MNFPELKLKSKREKSIINKHPWIFSGAVDKANAKEGDIVEVKSADGKTLGFGFYSKESQISCRMFHWGEKPEDFESSEYWQNKILKAVLLRKSFINYSQTNAYRLLHAEGDFLPGIIADIYNDVCVVQILIEGVNRRRSLFVEALTKAGFKNIFLRNSGSSKANQDVVMEGDWLAGSSSKEIEILEHGQKFLIDLEKGQKTGFFLDQRENRELIKAYSKGKTVLNAFSYTGGFSVYAHAGGAKEVHSLDISQPAVEGAITNVRLNYADANHKGISKDCFEYLNEMPADFYDFIILDPPAFAKSAKAVDRAARGYKDINLRAFRKIKSGGLLATFSCSQHISKDLFQKIIFGASADSGRNVRIVQHLHQPADHPVNIFHPEGEYLKGLLLWVE